jgi:hypothetical protein
MKRPACLAVLIALICAAPAAAGQSPAVPADTPSPPDQAPVPRQSSPQAPRTETASILSLNTTEWMLTGGPAFGTVVLHSSGGHRYVLQTVSWGRVLSEPRLNGALRGRFEWAFEAVPLFGQFAPDDVYGFGFSPLVWRWNFEPRGRFYQYAEVAGGALWTNDPLPERTTTANFSAHGGYGIRYFVRRRQAIVVGYWFHHISNGNRVERNPGVNAHVLQFGYSYLHTGQ